MIRHSLDSTLDKNQSPKWVQWINWSDRQLQQIDISLISLSEESLIENAQRKAQLWDWGSESFRLGLQTLLTSLHQEGSA